MVRRTTGSKLVCGAHRATPPSQRARIHPTGVLLTKRPASSSQTTHPKQQASRVLAQLLVAGAATLARAASQAWAQALQS
jgi:hypothetical protein